MFPLLNAGRLIGQLLRHHTTRRVATGVCSILYSSKEATAWSAIAKIPLSAIYRRATMYMIYRSWDQGMLGKSVRHLAKPTVLDWVRSVWSEASAQDAHDWLTDELGTTVYGLDCLFSKGDQHREPCRTSVFWPEHGSRMSTSATSTSTAFASSPTDWTTTWPTTSWTTSPSRPIPSGGPSPYTIRRYPRPSILLRAPRRSRHRYRSLIWPTTRRRGKAVCVDVRSLMRDVPGESPWIEPEHLEAHEKRMGRLLTGSVRRLHPAPARPRCAMRRHGRAEYGSSPERRSGTCRRAVQRTGLHREPGQPQGGSRGGRNVPVHAHQDRQIVRRPRTRRRLGAGLKTLQPTALQG